jgi:hypothetical protein
MNRRGWAAVDLARESRISQARISSALHNKPIAAQSLALIAKALSRVAAIEIVDELLRADAPHLD